MTDAEAAHLAADAKWSAGLAARLDRVQTVAPGSRKHPACRRACRSLDLSDLSAFGCQPSIVATFSIPRPPPPRPAPLRPALFCRSLDVKIAMGAFPALLSVLMLHTFSFSHVACAVPHLALHTPHTRTKAFTFVYYINIPAAKIGRLWIRKIVHFFRTSTTARSDNCAKIDKKRVSLL